MNKMKITHNSVDMVFFLCNMQVITTAPQCGLDLSTRIYKAEFTSQV